MTDAPIVSFADEPLILVDSHDKVLGYDTKEACHLGAGRLHRAFSVFLFDDQGRVLIQQRSQQKPLWPLIWANACCSHPRRGEELAAAVRRRLREELNVTGAEPEFLFKFEYQVPYEQIGAEHELCSVFFARYAGEVAVNPNEVAQYAWLPWQELDVDLKNRPDRYSPWLKMEWARMRADFWPRISRLWRTQESWDFERIRAHWLPAVEERLRASCEMDGLLHEMVLYHLGTGGKRLRALLPIWVCTNLGGDPEAALNLGVGIELLHNATLVHDDLQDGDQHRRGQPTVWNRWGDGQAINAGDSLYFQGIAQMLRAAGPEANGAGAACAEIAAATMVRVIQGQTMELNLQASDHDEETISLAKWEEMARAKTAALFGACMAAGAVAAKAPPEQVAQIASYGEQIGLLFQAQDDYLDLVGNKGRERRGSDLAEGKLSFVAVWALENAAQPDAQRLREILRTPRGEVADAMIDEGLEILERSGALRATAEWLNGRIEGLSRDPVAKLVPGLAQRILAPVAAALNLESKATEKG